MSKIVAVIETCHECPHREYESGGMYLCGKGGGQLEKTAQYPIGAPLQNYPTPTTQSFGEKYPRNPDAKCKCEHWQACIDCHPTYVAAVLKGDE